MEMNERRQSIVQMLEKQRAASVRELAAAVYASEASVRRDIEALEQAGIVRRVYGGVMLSRYANSFAPLAVRDSEHSAQKESLARAAAALVEDHDVLMLDASSTVRRMLRYLSGRRDLTIITNNARIFSEPVLCEARLYCVGGQYNSVNQAFVGPVAERAIRAMSADKLFFSSQFIDEQGEITDNSEADAAIRAAMMERAAVKICLMDHSKVGKRGLFTLCGREDVDRILCNKPLPWEAENQP